jgi:glucans biosynthesis protein C
MNESSERLHALDAVRGFSLLAGIVFHATVSFLPGRPGAVLWIVMDNHRSLALALTFHVLHTFRMTTFFFIAGYFAHLSLHKRGWRSFVRDRLKRIGLPLLVGWPILMPIVVGVSIWGALVMAHGKKLPPPPPYHFPAFPWTHLWFLYVLLLLYAAVLILRGLIVGLDRSGTLRRAIDACIRLLTNSGLLVVVLSAPAALALYLTPDWLMWFGVPTPDSSLVPNVAAATAFSVAFGFGFVAQRQAALLEAWRRQWPAYLAAAVLLTTCDLMLTGVVPVVVPEKSLTTKALYACCYALASWSWTLALVGLALRFLSGYSGARRYLADASYWFYLIHLPIVVALQIAVSQLSWPWFVKFAVILGVTFAVLFASYALFVRNTFIGVVLNGRRLGKVGRSVGPVTAQA